MKWVWALLLFLFSLGQIGRISIGGAPMFFYVYEVVFFGCLGLWLMEQKKIHIVHIIKQYAASAAFIFILISTYLFSLYWYSAFENVVAVGYLFRLAMYILWVCAAIPVMKWYRISPQFITVLISCYIGGLFGSAILQYWFYPNFGNIAYLGWDPHMYRLVGVFFEPPIAAAIYGLCGFSLLFVYQKKKTALFLTIAIFFGIMVFFTYSRVVMIAFSITLFVFLLRTWPKAVLVGLGGIAILLMMLPQSRNESINLSRVTTISTRQKDIEKGLRIVQKNPLFGIGYNHIRFEKDKLSEIILTERYNPSHASASFHNSFLIILVTTGITGLGVFLWWIWEMMRTRPFYFYALLFLSLASLGDNVILHPFILFLFPLLGGYLEIIRHADT